MKTTDETTKPGIPATEAPASNWPGIRHVLIVSAVMIVTFSLTYVVPGLEEYQPWLPEDGPPVARLFEDWQEGPRTSPLDFAREGEAFAQGAAEEDGVPSISDDELLAQAPLPAPQVVVPSIPASTVPDEAPSERPVPAETPTPTAPEQPELQPMAEAPAPPSPYAGARLPPAAYEGLTREIELPKNEDALDHFFEQLFAVQQKKGGAPKARVVLYSTSTNGSDRVSQQLRRLMDEHLGSGGKGFVPAAPAWKWQKHQDVEWDHAGWKTYDVTHRNRSDGRYGLSGVAARGHRGAWASFGTVDSGDINRSVSRFDVYYQAGPRYGELAIEVDGEVQKTIDTEADEVTDEMVSIDVAPGPHTLTLKVTSGPVMLYGVVMENDEPGVVVDAMMLIGAFAQRLNNFDAAHIGGQVATRKADLLVFWLGANDAAAKSVPFRPARFKRVYGEAIAKMKKGRPETSCLVMSVLDQGERRRGRVRTRKGLDRVIETQRELAREQGCAFFNTFEAIGGEGTMGRWYQNKPRLVTSDYAHPTVAGARVIGLLLGKSLLKAYDDWLAEQS